MWRFFFYFLKFLKELSTQKTKKFETTNLMKVQPYCQASQNLGLQNSRNFEFLTL